MSKILALPLKPSILPTDLFIVDDTVTTYKVPASMLFPGTVSGITRSIVNISSNTTLSFVPNIDVVAMCTNTITVTLPTAVGNTNTYQVNNQGVGTVTVATSLGQTINGLSNKVQPQYASYEYISNGTNWTLN